MYLQHGKYFTEFRAIFDLKYSIYVLFNKYGIQ